MITKTETRVRRLEKLIDRFGGGTLKTSALSAQPPSVVAELSTSSALQEGETGLLAFYGGPDHWLLLTSERLIWKEGVQVFELGWVEVHGVQQAPELSAKVIRGEVPAETVEDLEVFDSRGGRHVLRLEPGRGYNLIWSAITALCNHLRPPDQVDLTTRTESPA